MPGDIGIRVEIPDCRGRGTLCIEPAEVLGVVDPEDVFDSGRHWFCHSHAVRNPCKRVEKTGIVLRVRKQVVLSADSPGDR
jgi:hypothetical protein